MQTATLSPAQKAWATRRAQGWTPKAQRSAAPSNVIAKSDAPAPIAKPWLDPKPIVLPVDHMEPVTEFQYVTYWVDHPEVGCGFFRFFVLDKGLKKVRLFYISRLTAIVVDRRHFDDHHTPARKVDRKSIANIIRRNRALADRLNDEAKRDVMPDGGVYAERALALITGETLQ
jgi:hypothetical protein